MELHPLEGHEHITQKWLEQMLQCWLGCEVTVNSWSKSVPEGKQGFLSEITFLTLNYTTQKNDTEECKLVFKFLPKDQSLRNFMSNGRLAKREVEFYQFMRSFKLKEICHKCNVMLPVPEVYYAGYTDEAVTIVLRDLSVDGFKSVFIKDGSTLAQTMTALQAMAMVHAVGVLYLQQHGQEQELKHLAKEFETDFYDQFLVPNLKTLADMYPGSSRAKVFLNLIPLIKHIRSTSRRNPLFDTVIHGDLWTGQLLYSSDESSASIIDWQFCHIDNPVSDIMSMFFMSTDPQVLEESLVEILEAYWSTFRKVVQSGNECVDVSLEQLKENVENMWMYGFMFLAVSIHDFLNGDNISRARIDGYFNLLERRGVFTKFLRDFGNKN